MTPWWHHKWKHFRVPDAQIWCFLWSAAEQTLEQNVEETVFETPLCSLWRHSHAYSLVLIMKERRIGRKPLSNPKMADRATQQANLSVAMLFTTPDSKVHGANMGPTWVLSAPDGPHVGPMNLAIWDVIRGCRVNLNNLLSFSVD